MHPFNAVAQLLLGARAAFTLHADPVVTPIGIVLLLALAVLWSVLFALVAAGLRGWGAGVAALAFGALSLALPAIPAAAVGVLLYAAVVYAMRSLGLSEAWAYVRGLH